MWMYSPPMAEHLFPASTYLRFGADGNRDQRLAELAILTAARALNSQYEWSAHEPLGLERRTRGEEIIELLRWDTPLADAGERPGLNEPERTIIRVVRELIREPKLSREAFEGRAAPLRQPGPDGHRGPHRPLHAGQLHAQGVRRPAPAGQPAHAPAVAVSAGPRRAAPEGARRRPTAFERRCVARS